MTTTLDIKKCGMQRLLDYLDRIFGALGFAGSADQAFFNFHGNTLFIIDL